MFSVQATFRVNQLIQSEPRIGEIVSIEPVLLDLLKLAASQDCRSERWQLYETLKRTCSHFVGWNASKPELQNPGVYCQIIEALDTLLPTPELDGETMEDLNREVVVQRLRDAVIRICPTVQLQEIAG